MKYTLSPAAIAACLMGTAATAQDLGTNGVSLDVSQNLSYSDNLDLNTIGDSGLRSLTNLSLAYASATRANGLQFTASTTAEFGSDDGAENSFTDPVFGLSYRRDSKDAGFNIGANFRQSGVSSILGTQELIDAGFYRIDNGSQTDINYSAGFDFGRTKPISGSLSYSGNTRRYEDTDDASLLDFDNTRISGQLNFRFDDRITAQIEGGITQYEEEGDFDRTTTTLGLGARFAVNKSLSVDASIGQNDVEITEDGVSSSFGGLTYTLGGTQTLKDGILSASLSSSENENGRRTSINLSRELELKNGSLNFGLGGGRGQDGSFDPTYRVGYSQALPKGAAISVQATQSYETSSAGEEAINSSVSASYSTPLTRVSSLQATANYRATDGIGSNTEEATRLDLDVTYRHDLAQDWGVVGGYKRSVTTENGGSELSSNTVFVGLQKTFEWRP